MYLSLIITFFLFLVIILAGIQNSMPLNLKFFVWDLQISFAALIVYSSLIGVAIVLILTFPKLIRKSHRLKILKREFNELQEKMTVVGKKHADES
jgi:uncharacterized integral membrane protein